MKTILNVFIYFILLALASCADVKSTGDTTETETPVDPVDPVTAPALMTTFDTGTATSFSGVLNGPVSASAHGISAAVAGSECIDVNAVDDGFNDPAVTDAEACVYAHEALPDLHAYLKWSPPATVSASGAVGFADVSADTDPPVYHSIKTPDNRLHNLDRVPVRPAGFENAPMARIIGTMALYLSGGDLIEKDLSTDTETVKYTGGINRYHTLDKAVGKLFFTVGDETRLYKPDGSSERLIDLEGKNPIPNTNGIMYTDSVGGFGTNTAVYLKVDEAGNTSGPFRSNPVAWAAWITLSEGAAPTATPGISAAGVYGARFIFNAGKLYEIVSTEADFNIVNLNPYAGFIQAENYEDVKFCESAGVGYIYGELSEEYSPFAYPDGWFKLSRIDTDAGTGLILLDQTHAITSLACSGDDHTVLACAINRSTGLPETVRVTGANTDTPGITITDGCDSITQAP